MARVLVATSNIHFPFDPWRHGASFLLRHSAELDCSGEHSLTDDPEEADLVLFGEMGLGAGSIRLFESMKVGAPA